VLARDERAELVHDLFALAVRRHGDRELFDLTARRVPG
jgi:hypothetical protein